MRMTTYELFLCWIIIMLLVMVVGEAGIVNLHLAASPPEASQWAGIFPCPCSKSENYCDGI
jgi:hypothetical protein